MSGLLQLLGLFAAALLAGALNSVAGGGSLISFPALVAFGTPAILANATNTAAMWPGAVGSAWAYRRDARAYAGLTAFLLLPSLIGGLMGALVLVNTPPDLFNRVVPFLVLLATLLFALRGFFQRLARGGIAEGHVSITGYAWGFVFQLFVATYGGYFGAGIGFLMLGSLGIMGLGDIHGMNGVKTVLGAVINVIAFIYFAARGFVEWPLALLMATGAVVGGYGGARLARRVNRRLLNIFIVVVGLGVTAWLSSYRSRSLSAKFLSVRRHPPAGVENP